MEMLEAQGAEVELIDLASLPADIAFAELYGERTQKYKVDFIDKVEKAQKLVFVMAEYNGGFPGILKLFIDSLPPSVLHHKKAGLIGLSSGHTGALRPMDQFSNVLNYLQVDVISDKPKLSYIEDMIDASGNVTDARCIAELRAHAGRMVGL